MKFDSMEELIKNTPNDMDLGREARKLGPDSLLAVKYPNDQDLGSAVRKNYV